MKRATNHIGLGNCLHQLRSAAVVAHLIYTSLATGSQPPTQIPPPWYCLHFCLPKALVKLNAVVSSTRRLSCVLCSVHLTCQHQARQAACHCPSISCGTRAPFQLLKQTQDQCALARSVYTRSCNYKFKHKQSLLQHKHQSVINQQSMGTSLQ